MADEAKPETDAGRVDAATQAADAVDARQTPGAEQEPTVEEAEAAERAAPADEGVAKTYKAQVERGAALEGEGAADVANDGQPPAPKA